MKRFTLLVAGLAVVACSDAVRKLERETIIKRSARVESFAGSYRETGTAKNPVTTRIVYRRNPLLLCAVRSQSKKPVALLNAEPGRLTLYYPKSGFGIRYRNLPVATAAHELQYLENEYDWHLAHYSIAQTESRQIAGRQAIGIRYTPKADFATHPFVFSWQAYADEEFAFPLSNSMLRGDSQLYTVTFDEIQFNGSDNCAGIHSKPAAGATFADYDLHGRNITYAEASAQANFALARPRPFAGADFDRIVRVAGIVPAFTFVSSQMPYVTTYTQVKDYGLKLIPEEGIALQGKENYRVSFFGAFKTVWFRKGQVYHTVVSNRPLSDILSWLDQAN